MALFLLAILWFQPSLVRNPAKSVDETALAQIYERVDALNHGIAKTLETHLADYKREVAGLNEHNAERLLTRINDELATASLETSRYLQGQRLHLSDGINTLFDNALKGLRTKYDEEIAALDKQFSRKIQNSRSEHKDELATFARDVNARLQKHNHRQSGVLRQCAGATKSKVLEHYAIVKERCSKALSYKEEYDIIGKVLNDSQSVFDGWLESKYRNALWHFEQDYAKVHQRVEFSFSWQLWRVLIFEIVR